ncbi:MAG: acyloxyacyl hydrolase [Cyclobacteriaceae bacterium]|nr:acyloxyacyl hydrolase [Cyclobacteriaceae bacterium]
MIFPFRLLNAILIYFIFLHKPFAQGVPDAFAFDAGVVAFKGYISPHSSDVYHLMYGHPTGVELFFNKHTQGQKSWHQRYNFPAYGFSLSRINTHMDPTGVLLYGLSYMEFHLVRRPIGSVVIRAATGFTYSNHPYDREDNHLNNMISSTLTYNMQGRFGFKLNVTDHLYLYPTIMISHASNGSYKLPNGGINIISANIGMGYQFGSAPVVHQMEDAGKLDRKAHLNLAVSGAGKELYPTGGPKYGFFTIRAFVDKPVSHVSRLTTGLDFLFNRSLIEEIRRDPRVYGPIDYKRIGWVAGHELVVSKISVVTQVGYYIYRPYRGDQDFNLYQRYGLRWNFNENVYFTTLLKTHRARADTFDFGIGWRL